MYAPAAFRISDPADCLALVERLRFASLVVTADGRPLAAHVPLLVERGEAGAVRLIGHLARANPVARALAAAGAPLPALALFVESGAYVSPSLYAAKAEHGKVVPTWNYVAAQAAGTVTACDRDRTLAIVAALTDAEEAGRDHPWAVSDAPADYIDGMLKAIVGIEVAVESLEATAKLSQNRPAEDRAAVTAALAAGPLGPFMAG
ncbi:FMN-binding negative transcriptional regulator [Caenispirillum bisanense]|uniref:Negative transcriptional regulator, PaiB family n=1 Tax=Caenispirillum bisanense TaxID=414052 RepID=A0A286GX01_9PROT|nr:FMN-binding negative transcriptional regulator [Caenispirillum bisanense]SOE00068.1 negative transcriptional regulator, PaiB family [Caenispirillum bisanense]